METGFFIDLFDLYPHKHNPLPVFFQVIIQMKESHCLNMKIFCFRLIHGYSGESAVGVYACYHEICFFNPMGKTRIEPVPALQNRIAKFPLPSTAVFTYFCSPEIKICLN
jgi:hypothetical protein